jgi:hypothetical protein
MSAATPAKPSAKKRLMNVLLAPHVTEKTSLAPAGAQPVRVSRARRTHSGLEESLCALS